MESYPINYPSSGNEGAGDFYGSQRRLPGDVAASQSSLPFSAVDDGIDMDGMSRVRA